MTTTVSTSVSASPNPSPNTNADINTNQPHVLVVDDDPTVLRALSAMLKSLQYEVHATDSGADATHLLTTLPRIDCALLDVFMPGVDGLELLSIMKRARSRDMPIIMMSGSHDPETVRQCFRGGAEDFLQKPIEKAVLERRLQNAFAERDARRRERERTSSADVSGSADTHSASFLGGTSSSSTASHMSSASNLVSGGGTSGGSGLSPSSSIKMAEVVETPLQAVVQTLWDLLLGDYSPEYYKQTLLAVLKSLSATDLYRPAFTQFLSQMQLRRGVAEEGVPPHIADWLLHEFSGDSEAATAGRKSSLSATPPSLPGTKFGSAGAAEAKSAAIPFTSPVASTHSAGTVVGVEPMAPKELVDGIEERNGPKPLHADHSGIVHPIAVNASSSTVSASATASTTAPERLFTNKTNNVSDEVPPPAADVTSFGYDVLALTPDQLVGGVVEMFRLLGLLERFNIPPVKLARLVRRIERAYHGNPYHNFYHAMDVTQFAFAILYNAQMRLAPVISPLDQLSLLIAALCHDVDHPGTNNAFQINARSQLALLYNDISVLENHHAALGFSILSEDGIDILSSLEPADWKECRKLVVSCILATDMSRHFELVSKFKTRISTSALAAESKDDKLLLLNVIMKCADISNVVRPWRVYEKWVQCLTEEFFRQGDLERSLRIPVSPLMDRDTTSVPEMQFNFIEFVAAPLFRALAGEYSQLKELAVNLDLNRDVFKHRMSDPNFSYEELILQQQQQQLLEQQQQQAQLQQQHALQQQQEQAVVLPPISSEAIVNMELALELCDSDEELLNEMLADLVERGETHIIKANDAFKSGDWDSLHREAHTLKGSAATLACHPLRDAADVLSKSARLRKSEEIPTGLALLRREFKRFKEHVITVLKLSSA